MSTWKEMSDRDGVETLLAMGFIPTWLEELLDEGDKLHRKAGHCDRWFNAYNDLVSSYGNIQKRLVSRGYRAIIAEEKLEAVRKIAFDPENDDDPFVGEARALKKIREVLDK